MISQKIKGMLEGSSAIRALFEEGKKLGEKYGVENVCDFSIGNPNVPADPSFKEAIKDILDKEDPIYVHGYMNNAGYPEVRKAIAEYINENHNTSFDENNIVMCVGAASGLNVILGTILEQGEEVIAFAPYFLEYGSYVGNYGGIIKSIPANPPSFLPDLEKFKDAINENTKAVIINSPNNPTGVVYGEDTIKGISSILLEKQKEYGHDIFIIADEPYRELVYDSEVEVPYITKYYNNTLVAYSFSKSHSLPGERIGYVVIPSEADEYSDLFNGIVLCTRIFGFVNAPSLQQLAVARVLDKGADMEFYGRNRDILYQGLTEAGLECTNPEGAFYMWVKCPIDEKEFVEICKKHLILVVGGSGFEGPGYVRLAYCTSRETVEKAIPRFKEIMEEINNR